MITALDHYILAGDYWRATQGDAAIAELKQALKLEPDYREAAFDLGCIYGAMNRYDEAFEEFRSLLQTNPNNAVTHKYIGMLFHRRASSSHSREDWVSAQEALQQSLFFDPNDADVLDELAVVLLELGQYTDAARASRAAAKLAPKDRRIVYNQSAIGGQIMRKILFKGKWKEARQAWKAIC